MKAVYRGMDQAALDAGYNNSAAVRNSGLLLQDFDRRSAALRAAHDAHLDLRYGPAPRNRIDYFAADRPGSLLIFIHGGYWQMRAKETFSFLASGPLAHGMHVAMIGYTLAPDISLAGIVDEVCAAITWLKIHAADLGGDPDRMIVSGWSAGGHLTAMCLEQPGVIGGLAISGIYDLEPVRLSYLNEKLRLTEEDERSLSPLHRPLSPRPLVLACGTAELSELQRQSEQFAAARSGLPGKLLPLAQHDHFTILNELADPQGVLALEACALAGLGADAD
ncbi:alpha/beta hydrolase [Noviherbaspirillum cavernae]|uniref:Alpha/beta hydrolase n=1 Tax=Noviherbaspirillum cavernae TaxID=2320862 RepID=A0A418WVZ1_9BURK|nr:alpha/beta hydrolase [Noviherbaspirillum cavernae]RJF96759.1 alpha/beta hydrolase [Noviherbaspirillum cavernae]